MSFANKLETFMNFGKHQIDFTIKVNYPTRVTTETAQIIFQGGPFNGKQPSIIFKPTTPFRIAVVAKVRDLKLAAKMQLKLGVIQTITESMINAKYDDDGDSNDYYEMIRSNTRDGGTDQRFPWYDQKQIDLGINDNPPELVVTDQPTLEVPVNHKIFGNLQSASSEQFFSSYIVLQEQEQEAVNFLYVYRVLWKNEVYGKGNPIVLEESRCGMTVTSQNFLKNEEINNQPDDVELLKGPANSMMERSMVQKSQFGGKPNLIEYLNE